VIARGQYLFHAVAHCNACHLPTQDYVGMKPGTFPPPKGGHEWVMGPIGRVRAPNLTPHPTTGLADYTDEQLGRAIRYGVKANAQAAPFMFAVGPMSDEDLTALVSYVRSVEPVEHAVAPSEIGLLGKVLFQGPMAFFASPHDYAAFAVPYVPEGTTSLERGRYLARGPGGCFGCHSDFSFDDGIAIAGDPFSGGIDSPFPDETADDYEFVAPNLTPDPENGILNGWTQAQFRTRFASGRMYAGTPMPWESYANLTAADVDSLWLYFRSLPAARKVVGPTYRKKGEAPA
jgi:mono/diheme cytochrome c family protein